MQEARRLKSSSKINQNSMNKPLNSSPELFEIERRIGDVLAASLGLTGHVLGTLNVFACLQVSKALLALA